MSKGIIVAGFGAIGKTTLEKKYNNVIDLECGYYKWINIGFENIPYEKRKGKNERMPNPEWPENYFKAILESQKKFDIVLTSMHWILLEFLEYNKIEYYIAYPTLDSEEVLVNRCVNRGNNDLFIDKLVINFRNWRCKLSNYNPRKIIYIGKDEYLEDSLKKEKLL